MYARSNTRLHRPACPGADLRRVCHGRRGEKPFFLYVSFWKPHAPYEVPAPFDSMYDEVEIPLPERVTLEDIRRLPPPLQKQILRSRPLHDMDRERLQWIYRSYYASVSHVDREVGRLLDTLERSGRSEETIVVFSTDHGDQLLEHGLIGKNVFFEASVRIRTMRLICPLTPPSTRLPSVGCTASE